MLPVLRHALGAACAGAAGAALLLPGSAAADQEEKVPLDKLPPSVLAAAKKAVPDAKWLQAFKDDTDGEVSYEVVGVLPKKRLVIVEVDPDGEVIEVDTQIDPDDIPKNVMKAFRDKFPKIKI